MLITKALLGLSASAVPPFRHAAREVADDASYDRVRRAPGGVAIVERDRQPRFGQRAFGEVGEGARRVEPGIPG